MPTTAATELERKRLAEICWWLQPDCRAFCDSTAVAWETLRRTSVYRSFWENASVARRIGQTPSAPATFQAVRDVIFKNKPSNADHREWLPLGDYDPIRKWSELFLRECDPDLNWIQLGDGRRHTVLFNSPILPRQERPEGYSKMEIIICEQIGRASCRERV